MQQGFSERLLAFEGYISSTSNGDWFALRQFLGFERDYTTLGPSLLQSNAGGWLSITSLSAKNKIALGNLLLAYRTIDVAATLENHPELPLKYEQLNDFGGSIEVEIMFLFFSIQLLLNHFSAIPSPS
jgi:hypothetical protein